MGPGCFYPGNVAGIPSPYFNGLLQWGRDVSIPEMGWPLGIAPVIPKASMGPGCFYPGNSTGTPAEAPPARLQWGRDVSIPEMGADGRIVWVFNVLQWGRDVSIPEIPPTL